MKGLSLDHKGVIKNSFPITFLSTPIGDRYVFTFELQCPVLAMNYLFTLHCNQGKNHTPSANDMDFLRVTAFIGNGIQLVTNWDVKIKPPTAYRHSVKHPLLAACSRGALNIVRYLIEEKQCDPNPRDHSD